MMILFSYNIIVLFLNVRYEWKFKTIISLVSNKICNFKKMVKFKNFENVITFLEKIIDRILFMMDLNVNLYLLP